MKFIIGRTSLYDIGKPCDEAMKETGFWRTHERTCTEKYYNKNFAEREGGEWRSKGRNHKRLGGGIYREEPTQDVYWTIEIDSLKGLIGLQEKYGKIILTKSGLIEIPLALEIYDDYRE